MGLVRKSGIRDPGNLTLASARCSIDLEGGLCRCVRVGGKTSTPEPTDRSLGPALSFSKARGLVIAILAVISGDRCPVETAILLVQRHRVDGAFGRERIAPVRLELCFVPPLLCGGDCWTSVYRPGSHVFIATPSGRRDVGSHARVLPATSTKCRRTSSLSTTMKPILQSSMALQAPALPPLQGRNLHHLLPLPQQAPDLEGR